MYNALCSKCFSIVGKSSIRIDWEMRNEKLRNESSTDPCALCWDFRGRGASTLKEFSSHFSGKVFR